MRKPRHREVEELAQAHTAIKRMFQDSNPGSLALVSAWCDPAFRTAWRSELGSPRPVCWMEGRGQRGWPKGSRMDKKEGQLDAGKVGVGNL